MAAKAAASKPNATTFHWGIANMEHNLADGKITQIHWTVSATDGVYNSGAYGSIGLEGDVVVPYKDLTPDVCIGWVKAHFGDDKVTEIEAALEQQLESQRQPKTAAGLPWAAAATTPANAASVA